MIETAVAMFAGFTAANLTQDLISGLVYDVIKHGAAQPGAALRNKLNIARDENRLPTNHTIERAVRRAAISATLTAIEKFRGEDLGAALAHHTQNKEQKKQVERDCVHCMKVLRKRLSELRDTYHHQGWDSPRTQAKLTAQLKNIGGQLTENVVDKSIIESLRAQISKTDEGAEAAAYAALMLEVVLEVPEWPGTLRDRLRGHFAPLFVGDTPLWLKLFPLYFAQEMKDDPALHVILAHQKLDWIGQQVSVAQEDLRAFSELSKEQGDALMHAMMEGNTALSELIASQAQQDRVLSDILEMNWLLSNKVRAEIEGMFREPRERFASDAGDIDDDFRQFHFSARGDTFLGRKKQLKRIESEFLACPLIATTRAEAFGWMAISGEAGTGKSRLAQEIISRNLGRFRVAGFATDKLLENPNFGPEHSDAFSHPILIVIDYTAGHQHQIPEFMRGWAEYGRRAVAEGRAPVRIILLLRRDDERVLSDIRNLGGNAHDPLLETGETFRSEPDMVLQDLTDEETVDLMRARIKSTSARDPDGRAPIKLRGEELLGKLKSFDEQKRPLFAIMVAHGLQNGTLPRIDGQQDEELARAELFTKYLKSQWVNTWTKRASQKLESDDRQKSDDMLAQHANLMRVVTACGGTEREPVLALIDQLAKTDRRMSQRFPKTDLAGEGVVEDRVLISMAGGRGSFNKYDELDPIPSLEPDLVGECFVITTPKDFEVQTKLWCHTEDVIQLAWQIDASRTANFLRLMTLDYPRRLHEANWYPCKITDVADARARARLLRNVSLDTSYSCKKRWVTIAEMTRLFDLCDRFEEELSTYLKSDEEVRRYHGQVLERVSNVAANVANLNITVDDIEKYGGQSDTDVAITKRFAGSAGGDEDGQTPGGSKPPSDALIKLVAKRYAALKAPIMAGVAPNIPFEQQEPFSRAFRSMIGSYYWSKRDDKKSGGNWPVPRSEKETAELTTLRDDVLTRIALQDEIDELATASRMLISISYAEWGAPIDVYQGAVETVSDTLSKITEIPPKHAGDIIYFAGNFLAGVTQKANKENTVETLAYVDLVDQLVQSVVLKVALGEGQKGRDIRRYYVSAWNLMGRRYDDTLDKLKPCPEEVQATLVSQAAIVSPAIKIFAELLIPLTAYLQRLPTRGERSPEQETSYGTIFGLITKLIDDARMEGDEFRVPAFKGMRYLLWCWILRLDPEHIDLPDPHVRDLLDLLNRHVGQVAQDEILKSVAGIVPDFPEHWMKMPGEPLVEYFAKLRDRNGPSRQLSEATLAIWAQLLLASEHRIVLGQVTDLLLQGQAAKDPAQIRKRTLAMRGISLLASGFIPDDEALGTFKEPVLEAQPLGRNIAAELFAHGMENTKATALVKAHNEALSNAVGSLARLDILAGGDPMSWRASKESS